MLAKSLQVIALSFVLFYASACTATNNPLNDKYIVLEYNDFIAEQLAEELIGAHYWQWWESSIHSRPIKFDIKIVVYRNIRLDKIKELFPVNEKAEKDYRYVHYDKAIKWFDKTLNDFEKDIQRNLLDEDKLANVTAPYVYFYFDLSAIRLKVDRTLRK